MNVHECAGEKSYSVFGINLSHSCCCDHEELSHEDSCCSDKDISVKASDVDKHLKKDIVLKKFNFEVAIFPTFFIAKDNTLPAQVQMPLIQSEFPPSHSPPLYILYGVFRI